MYQKWWCKTKYRREATSNLHTSPRWDNHTGWPGDKQKKLTNYGWPGDKQKKLTNQLTNFHTCIILWSCPENPISSPSAGSEVKPWPGRSSATACTSALMFCTQFTHTHTHMRARTHTHTHICTHTHTHILTHTHSTPTHSCIHTQTYVMHTYTHTHTHTNTKSSKLLISHQCKSQSTVQYL